jgi:phenylalanine-4-hydroxylase
MSAIGLKYIDNPSALELISRIYWYTVEFGLIKENGNLRIYGAGILSSPGESRFCLSDDAVRYPFNVDDVLESYYIKEKFQEKYFVLESYQQLAESIPEIAEKIKAYVDKGIYVEPNAVFTERINRELTQTV